MPQPTLLNATMSSGRQRPAIQRNPFDSPDHSVSSFHGSDVGGSSEDDEITEAKYGAGSVYQHLRQQSSSTNFEPRDKKPHLNVITNLNGPKMPMKADGVLVNEVVARQARADRKNKALSIVSHKAVSATASPAVITQPSNVGTTSKIARRVKPIQRIRDVIKTTELSPVTQRIPIGITIPKQDAAKIDQTVTDSALPMTTPLTPAIVVTPAGDRKPWLVQRRGTGDSAEQAHGSYPSFAKRSAGTALSQKSTKDIHKNIDAQSSLEDETPILYDSADTARPKSQGWWNLMLSPMLRAGSIASRKGKPSGDTPPVPPLPFSPDKDSPALSARSDPSFLVSETGTSPDTPRRLGLASARASTWSRWTEWEQEREGKVPSLPQAEDETRGLGDSEEDILVNVPPPPKIGLAAEYYHACAVEQLTDRPYFECLEHSCAEKLPKLHSEFDDKLTKPQLASPFESPLPRDLASSGIEANRAHPNALSPNELSPNVREASVMPIIKAKVSESGSDKGSDTASNKSPPLRQQDKEEASKKTATAIEQTSATNPVPHNDVDSSPMAKAAVTPSVVEIKVSHEHQLPVAGSYPMTGAVAETVPEKAPFAAVDPVISPSPMSPEGQKSLAPFGAVPLNDYEKQSQYSAPVVFNNYAHQEQLPHRPAFITADTEYPPLPDRQPVAPVTAADLEATTRKTSIEARRQRRENEDSAARKIGGLWRGRGCFPRNGCMGKGGPEGRTKRRWIAGLGVLLLAIIIACIVLAITLTRHGDGTPVDSQWLNLTGYPPMPTGILTIAAPKLAASENKCFSPGTIWSCSVPMADRDEIGANEADSPNFRFEIKFRNGTVPSNMTIPLNGSGKKSKTSNDPFTNDLFVPNPQPPNQADQLFMGNTTDNITAPFDGEETPFYMTFMAPFPIDPSSLSSSAVEEDDKASSLSRRQTNSSLTNAIPGPALAEDGSAAPATLLPTDPFPISQPVRLYNRGLQDEHYGFYIYYDKSIYLSGVTFSDDNENAQISAPEADQNGGCSKSQATAVCTFAQTRFLVKAFTNPSFATLLASTTNSNLTAPEDQKSQKKNTTSSATNFERPGSFPYPASIVLDRHGGDVDDKGAYCYGMTNGQINRSQKTVLGEARALGGSLINAAPQILQNSADFNKSLGGIDGGTGGCSCNWQNFE